MIRTAHRNVSAPLVFVRNSEAESSDRFCLLTASVKCADVDFTMSGCNGPKMIMPPVLSTIRQVLRSPAVISFCIRKSNKEGYMKTHLSAFELAGEFCFAFVFRYKIFPLAYEKELSHGSSYKCEKSAQINQSILPDFSTSHNSGQMCPLLIHHGSLAVLFFHNPSQLSCHKICRKTTCGI